LAQEQWTAIQPADLLESLRAHLSPIPFTLALYCRQELAASDRKPSLSLCGLLGRNTLCAAGCRKTRETAAERALSSNRPAVFHCPGGLLNFAVPFSDGQTGASCLIGGGVREPSLDLRHLEALSNAGNSDGATLLERIETLPIASRDEVEAAARKVHQFIPSLLSRNLYALALEKATHQLDTLTGISSEIDGAATLDQLFTLIGEALVVLFNLDAFAMVLAKGDGQVFLVQGAMGLNLPPDGVAAGQAMEFLRRHPLGSPIHLKEDIRSLFPGINRNHAVCVPLVNGREALGFLALFGEGPVARDLRLIELLAGRTAARLRSLLETETTKREKAQAERLVAMISALSLSANCEELYRSVVDMAADLLEADSGSLMLVAEDGEVLQVKAAKGMHPALARSMRVRVGAGIAGRVAGSGLPLLVADIEKDSRTAILNRPRFRTKSFLSVPLKLRERVIGVLNLADKENNEIFSQTDLNALAILADHAALMTERTRAFERTSLLEELSVTDPLTGLYNRRLLEKRLDEEISRSRRQQQNFSLLMIDLDNFKAYNDLCGHPGGDLALEKTAILLQGCAREMDVVARYGGEEFCVLVAGTAKKESVFVAERIRRAIENEPFPREKELPLGRLTASIGVAAFPENGESAADLLRAADAALYQAKDEGRNRIVLFDPKRRQASLQAG
jgi:diguanylate cyclase (GGDEF)-like protein